MSQKTVNAIMCLLLGFALTISFAIHMKLLQMCMNILNVTCSGSQFYLFSIISFSIVMLFVCSMMTAAKRNNIEEYSYETLTETVTAGKEDDLFAA